MALTEAEQEHLAQVRAKMVLVMHQSLTFQQQADAILALTGDYGTPLLAVRQPEQTAPGSPAATRSSCRVAACRAGAASRSPPRPASSPGSATRG